MNGGVLLSIQAVATVKPPKPLSSVCKFDGSPESFNPPLGIQDGESIVIATNGPCRVLFDGNEVLMIGPGVPVKIQVRGYTVADVQLFDPTGFGFTYYATGWVEE